MTELERALTRQHCRRWRRSRKSPLEIPAGLLTVAALLLVIASLAHAESVMERHMVNAPGRAIPSQLQLVAKGVIDR